MTVTGVSHCLSLSTVSNNNELRVQQCRVHHLRCFQKDIFPPHSNALFVMMPLSNYQAHLLCLVRRYPAITFERCGISVICRHHRNILWLPCRPSTTQIAKTEWQTEVGGGGGVQDKGFKDQGPFWRPTNREPGARNQRLQGQGVFWCRVHGVFSNWNSSKLSTRMTSLAASWQSAKVIRTREKVSFFLGVMNLIFSSLIFAKAPQYALFVLHLSYSHQPST